MTESTYSGTRLREVMTAQGRRWDWLARTAGVDRTLLFKIANGQSTFTPRTARLVADALGIDMWELQERVAVEEREAVVQ